MCGFIGVTGSRTAVREIYDGLVAVQHRGQDAAGIITYDGRFHLKKGSGLVRDIFRAEDIDRLKGAIGVGHVRYPTIGSGGAEDAQPFTVNYPFGIVIAHNGNVANYDELAAELQREGRHLYSRCDVEVVLNVFANGLAEAVTDGFSLEAYYAAVQSVYRRVRGAYSVTGFIAGHGMFAFRDPYGIKPIVMGSRPGPDGRPVHAVASESVVLHVAGFDVDAPGPPGEAVFIDLEGRVDRRQLVEPKHHPCVFEYVYFARPDSTLEGVSVYQARMRQGETLAQTFRETGHAADVVVPVPDSARTSALSMAQSLGLPYREGLVKNRYVGRTFIMPNDGERRNSVRHKLNAIEEEFRDRRVLLVDDSIVRGNTSRKIVEMVRGCGAAEVHFAFASPPLVHPCVYGIDMSTRREFIARDRTPEEVAELIGADSVTYQQLDDLLDSVRRGNPAIQQMCHACFSGDYPTGDITSEMLLQIENERLVHQD